MQCLDYCKVWVESGKGGDGCVAFRREKFVLFGGAFGGDGGSGGSVIFKATSKISTLLFYCQKCHFCAPNGGNGRGKMCHGSNGIDLELLVPVGTQILEEDGITLIANLDQEGQYIKVLKGGRGGYGNIHYKSSTYQTPFKAVPGQIGQKKWIILRLKYIGDIGLIGKPNVGKSTLLSKISNANPKIADYPFTTIYPNLGIVSLHNQEFTVVDIPGLIVGSSQGKGLGYRFLQHVEKCISLAYLISSEEDVIASYLEVTTELSQYNSCLLAKPKIIILTKADLCTKEQITEKISKLRIYSKEKNIIAISSNQNYQIDQVKCLMHLVYQTQSSNNTLNSRWHPLNP